MSKIILLIPNLGLGGAQRVFHDHSVALAQHYQVTEVVFNMEGGNLNPSQNELVSLEVPGGGSLVQKISHFWQRIARLRAIKNEIAPAACISHLEGADYVSILSGGKGANILCIHGSKLHDRNIKGVLGWLRQRIFIPLLYRRAARIVTVSSGIRQELVETLGLPAHKICVINNFFNTEQISKQAQASPPAPYEELLASYPVIATSGRLSAEKNLMALLEVFAQVRQQVPACKLLLIGQGEQYEALLTRCEQLNLAVHLPGQPAEAMQPAAVVFTGLQTNPHALVSRATLFVLPSLNEGFPMALGEAMACGRPVAAADCPTGPREMMAPATQSPATALRHAEQAEYGVLLPVISNPASRAADVQQWAQALVALLANATERARLGAAARRRMEDFVPERVFAQWIALIKDATQAQ